MGYHGTSKVDFLSIHFATFVQLFYIAALKHVLFQFPFHVDITASRRLGDGERAQG